MINKKTARYVYFGLFALALITLFSSCAEPFAMTECLPEKVYGFWHGLLHGFIAPFAFIASLFFDDVAMYGCNNIGALYDLGFVIGASIIFGGGSKASCRRKR
jgi:hypothetical protein